MPEYCFNVALHVIKIAFAVECNCQALRFIRHIAFALLIKCGALKETADGAAVVVVVHERFQD